ncbi:unnamed protein product [Staurois parvus]|uniref:MYND-type domain-containing protein n=1 Tax=Staurois parvus TaxID=386267 RepID=A0ABN9AH79_9NEOB|nr:unnamed protein product [Staurois parvus]
MASVNPLSNAKGVKLVCELCHSPAYIQCPGCKVTYYCDADHQRADWTSIHEKICQLLIPVRAAFPFLTSAEERAHSAEQLLQRKKHLIDLTTKEAQRLLYEGRHVDVIPAATHALSFSIDVYGLTSVELVPVYLILAEANIGLGNLTQAEEYLSHAYWTVLKTTDCSNLIRSKLHRNLGLLYSAKGEFEESLRHLSNDIYYASTVSGPSDISTAGGYFHMANVFFRQNKMDIADSLYSEVDRLCQIISSSYLKLLEYIYVTDQFILICCNVLAIDENQEAEALQILSAIYDIREQAAKKEPAKIAKVLHALAMLHYLRVDFKVVSLPPKDLLFKLLAYRLSFQIKYS